MKKINLYLQKLFDSDRIKLPLEIISHYLVKAAKSQSYVETLGKHADSLHMWIKRNYEVDLKRAFEKVTRQAIRLLRIHNAQLAFDITHEPFYGNSRNMYIFNKANYPYKGEFQYITCCLINKNKQIPLMALPVPYGGQTRLTIDLLKYCQSLFKKISFVLFDRGFYRAELIDFLQSKKINYLIFTPKHGTAMKNHIRTTKNFATYEHQLKYKKDKSSWKPKTNLVVCKNIFDHNWIFATNIKCKTALDYVLLYKRRWQIETNYRVEDEAKIKSKSNHYLIRYFYFLISMLLHTFWIINKNLNYYVPFKKYLDIIEQKLMFDYLGIKQI